MPEEQHFADSVDDGLDLMSLHVLTAIITLVSKLLHLKSALGNDDSHPAVCSCVVTLHLLGLCFHPAADMTALSAG